MTVEAKPSPSKSKSYDSKTKIAIANTVKNAQSRPNYSTQLEEYQNKENENPQKDAVISVPKAKDVIREPGFYSSEEDALYAQVNVRLEPEGESRDTEDESERSLTSPNEPSLSIDGKGLKNDGKIYNCPRIELETETECGYSLPKIVSSSNDVDQLEKPDNNPEELYAAINKVGVSRKNEFPVPDEVWDVSDVKKSLHKVWRETFPLFINFSFFFFLFYKLFIILNRMLAKERCLRNCFLVVDEDLEFTELRNIEAIGWLPNTKFTTSARGENGNAGHLQQPRAEGHRSYRRHRVPVVEIRHRILDSIVIGAIRGISPTGSIRAQLVTLFKFSIVGTCYLPHRFAR